MKEYNVEISNVIVIYGRIVDECEDISDVQEVFIDIISNALQPYGLNINIHYETLDISVT